MFKIIKYYSISYPHIIVYLLVKFIPSPTHLYGPRGRSPEDTR